MNRGSHGLAQAKHGVLWVEDDAQDRLLIGAALDDLGIDGVRFLRSGQELIDCLEVVRPERIVLDLGIPDVPGDELLRMVRDCEHTADTPVAVFSGLAQAMDCGGHEASLDRCVTKPLRWSDYPVAVGQALGHP